jgi:hypothetical protein
VLAPTHATPVGRFEHAVRLGLLIANTTSGAVILLVDGTGGNDTYAASTTQSMLTNTGLSPVGNGFDQVFALGSGGNDMANFTGNSGDDVFY